MIAAALAAAACSRAETRVAAMDAAAAAVDVTPDARAYAVARPAIRCAECHGKMHTEWTASAHAVAARSPLYRAMRDQAPATLRCDRCHAPLAAVLEPGDPVIDEGVTCEVCHTIAAVDDAGRFELRLAENVLRGPLCDARDHYFHKMGCSPLHAESRFCAACHELRLGDVPVYTEVSDFRESPYADMLECQDCHMPAGMAEVAEGSPARDGVGHHGFAAGDRGLFMRALTGRLRARRVADGVEVQVTVKNANAGHPVPGGMPGRQLVVRVSGVDRRGGVVARGERVYQRLLVGDGGGAAPFWRARREAADTRLRPKEVRVEEFAFLGEVRRVRLEVVRREIAPELAAIVGQPPAVEEVLVRAEVAPGGAADWQQ